jgi:hypothetical protein
MVKSVTLRDSDVPAKLVVLRMGSNTLSDNSMAQACERAYAAMGVHAFPVFEIPNHDYQELATLEPILITRPKVLEASGPGLVAAGFTLLPTAGFRTGRWSSRSRRRPSSPGCASTSSHGPVDNPIWTRRKG